MIPVTVFNTSPLQLIVAVNNGSQATISGMNYGSWTPGIGPTGPAWSGTGPGPNALGPGANSMMVRSQGGLDATNVAVNLPTHLNPSSVQVYLFTGGNASLTWMALYAGTLVASGTAAAHQNVQV